MKILLVVSLEMPDAEHVIDVLDRIDPPSLPWFDSEVRIVLPEHVEKVLAFMDEE